MSHQQSSDNPHATLHKLYTSGGIYYFLSAALVVHPVLRRADLNGTVLDMHTFASGTVGAAGGYSVEHLLPVLTATAAFYLCVSAATPFLHKRRMFRVCCTNPLAGALVVQASTEHGFLPWFVLIPSDVCIVGAPVQQAHLLSPFAPFHEPTFLMRCSGCC